MFVRGKIQILFTRTRVHYIRGGFWVIMLAGFCLPFVRKQRCPPGWVVHSFPVHVCMPHAKTVCGSGAVIAGLDKAKREHEKSAAQKSVTKHEVNATEAYQKKSRTKRKADNIKTPKKPSARQRYRGTAREGRGHPWGPPYDSPKGSDSEAKKQSSRQGHTAFARMAASRCNA